MDMNPQTEQATKTQTGQNGNNLDVAKALIKKLISDKRIIVDRDEVEDVLEEIANEDIDVSELFDEMRMKDLLNVENLTPESEIDTYIFLPKQIKLSDDELLFLRVMINNLSDEDATIMFAEYMYEKYAGGLEFADEENDGYIAWYLWQLAQSYGVNPDEIVDKFDYSRTYTGSKYYRYGNTWIEKHVGYANYNRWGESVGIQKGYTYSLRAPDDEE
jgi:hypothetical protein